jgi:diadenosine tetraphosphate (Ap4A) HIT family hydrolase
VSGAAAAGFRPTGRGRRPLGGPHPRAKLEKLPYVLVVGDDDVAGHRGRQPPWRRGRARRRVDAFVERREVADLDGLTAEETSDLWATVTEAVRVVRRTYSPDGMNVGLNLGRPAGGSVPDHLHVHVVPRWTGDSNFMSAIANTQTLPEALVDTAAKLRAGWVSVTGERQ